MANELTWEDEQDINDYLTWKIDNDWATAKGYATMPTTIVKETTVYTLEELDENFGWNVYEKAIENALTWAWEGFEPSFLTEDLTYMIKEDFPLFEIDKRSYRTVSGKTGYEATLYWGMNPYSAEAKGTVNVARFMQHFKLCNKYRLVWTLMRKHGLDLDAPVAFGSGRDDDADLSDLQHDIEYCDDTVYKSPRGQKIDAQIEALQAEIEDYVGEIYTKVLEYIRLEDTYRCSDEFAKEEAEAAELTFTEDGDIFHG